MCLWGDAMAKIKKAKRAKQPKKPFREVEPVDKDIPKVERKLNKKAIKEAIKRKKAFEKRLDRSIGACAVILCIISSCLDVALRSKDKA